MWWTSSADPALRVDLRAALSSNLAPDGGLFCLVPERWNDWDDLLRMPWPDRGAEIVTRLAHGALDATAVRRAAREALDIATPLRRLDRNTYAFELFHGPSLAFKDFGARMLARLLPLVDDRPGQPRTVLTATSGDTGAAVVAAFLGVPGARAVVLYPKGRVSALQERQIACMGGNTVALQVAGSFDDCQAMVKAAFADARLAGDLRLTSANSIHVGRLVAQMTYFSEIAGKLRAAAVDDEPVVAVPSGNFGHLCAGLYAKAIGVPLGPLVVATNRNRTVPDHLDGLGWRPRPSVATPSNAMDVGAPNNWPRVETLFGGDLDRIRGALRWGSADDEATMSALARYSQGGIAVDPHTAVALAVLERARRPGECGVAVATAHPAKFAEVVETALGQPVALPEPLRDIATRTVPLRPLPADPEALIAWLRMGSKV
ncbi:MAG: threonine synthase [Deltaproteobacteria bacterium]|nr:threonine synthase [Deltaproteobacteria bacterium]